MNRDEVIKMLVAILNSFRVHSALVDDLTAIMTQSGYENRFFNLLITRLKFLREQGVNAIRHKEFESLSHCDGDGIFSMHFTGPGFNIRILYAFAPDQSPVLLVGFFEKAGKRKTDYSNYIPIARRRLEEELEAYHE